MPYQGFGIGAKQSWPNEESFQVGSPSKQFGPRGRDVRNTCIAGGSKII